MRDEDRDTAYMWDMRDFAREAHKLVHRISFEQLERDAMRKRALERVLELLGEAARRVSDDAQRRLPAIEWRQVIGQRNILAHEYGEIVHRRLYDNARAKLPGLITELDGILGEEK